MSALTALVLVAAMNQPLTPAYGTLKTRWASQVSKTCPRPEYPRPQMVRKTWKNLNGPWDLWVKYPANGQELTDLVGKILVPFPVESQLSGIQKMVPPTATVVYQRMFDAPKGERVLLHFGAVDWHAQVFVNDKLVGEHKGGYTPFSFDVTPYLHKEGRQKLAVHVQDPTDKGDQPRGKQVLNAEGIWYTPITGIWQTVWVESVPNTSVEKVRIQTKNDGTVSFSAKLNGPNPANLTAVVMDGDQVVANAETMASTRMATNNLIRGTIKVAGPKLWSPSDPHRYTLVVKAGKDEVKCPFAIREVKVGKAKDGKTRILLNGQPIFMVGPLDQGYWPDGLYTAPTHSAMVYDLQVTQDLGFNMIRKHVKVEPDTWYDECDKRGILVFQDMPSRFFAGDAPTAEGQAQYYAEQKEMVEALYNHPSIVAWVPYNEGWGQYDTEAVVDWLRKQDNTRIIDNASGWTDKNVGDVIDYHIYPGPGSPKPESKRAAVLGEFGGLGFAVPEHSWKSTGWGYQSFEKKQALQDRFDGIFTSLHRLIGEPGCSAAVYTQTTDVEIEINGLMTYDRAILKVDKARTRKVMDALHTPPPVTKTLLSTAETEAAKWQYTFETPAEKWESSQFDDSAWMTGEAGFGTAETPGSIVRTEWNGADIWMRRKFVLPKIALGQQFALRVHHDEDAEIYLDGVLIAKLRGYISEYQSVDLDAKVAKMLVPGPHVLAIHCHQTRGGQYIDAGIETIYTKK